jgi:phosphoribosyl 1,2-cyclic phosphodiesterase
LTPVDSDFEVNLMGTEGVLTFWGVRGSIPAPGIDTMIFGGNTSCVSVEYEDYIFIFDAGSGIRKLGQHLSRFAE